MRAGHADVLLAASGGARAAHVLVHPEPGAQDGRVSHASRYLPGQAAGGGYARHLALLIQGQAVDRPRGRVHGHLRGPGEQFRRSALREVPHQGSRRLRRGVQTRPPVVVAAPVTQGFLPNQPGQPRLLGQQILFLKAESLGEPERALAHQHDVVALFHDQPRDFRRRLDIAQRRHGPATARRPVHHRSIQLDHALLVGQAAVTNRVIVGVLFVDVDSRDHGIERVPAGLHLVHGTGTRPQPVRARDDDGPGRRGRYTAPGGRKQGGIQYQLPSVDHVRSIFQYRPFGPQWYTA